MVKNTHGGSGHKKFGRKFANQNSGNSRLRVSENEFEMYAIVMKMCGNNMVHVHCLDNVMRLCYIRGKFTGRRKRDNMVVVGGWVMVGLREYDDTPTTASSAAKTKLAGCDLLEVYSSSEKEQLKSNVDEKWINLMSHDTSSTLVKTEHNKKEEDVRFTTEHDDDLDELLQVQAAGDAKVIGTSASAGASETVDVDCI
jgi:initiation factor 1A